ALREAGESNPRTQAGLVAYGELLSTVIGAARLRQEGLQVSWQDARAFMRSVPHPLHSMEQRYLSASCDYAPDAELQERFRGLEGVILTQGFIASDASGETVLLGREGSDTSAAYLAAKLLAHRVEIWTDVPGMFTADPRLVPSARLLVDLHYDEARELASTGSRVLHPRCLSPLSRNGIPLFVRCTQAPEMQGTIVSPAPRETAPQVKGISARSGITLISLDGMAMWHEVGFLAAVFATFAGHGVSVDLISTSESNVTVSVDDMDGMFPAQVRDALVADLEKLCRVRVIPSCAVVSLVGRSIRTYLSRLAPALAVFEEEKIHLVSQGASDLNFSFVIDEQQATRLLGKLHASMIRGAGGSTVFGPSWEQLFLPPRPLVRERDWWVEKRQQLLDIAASHSSAYVYDAATVTAAARDVLSLRAVDRVLYAMKANANPAVLRLLADAGIDFDCVSPGEVSRLLGAVAGLDASRILYTPNFAAREEYAWALGEGLQVTLDSLYPLQRWPELFNGRKLFVRVDTGQGRGHHDHVRTAGIHSKFGVPLFEIDELAGLVDAAGASIAGIHAHSGSGILDPDNWRAVAELLVGVARRFPDAAVLDLGGGIGIPDKPGQPAFDFGALDAMLGEFKAAHPQYQLWLEPGRYLVAQAGVLIARVTQIKGKREMRYIGIATGMNSLIRPALYGAYHEIINLSRLGEPATETATIVGPICESGDKLGSDRLLPVTSENDVLLIVNAGAYGRVMSSNYNLREPAAEFVI
ncbi:MAG: bifunctional aspartate kinase/diaminopimelate decarboxylase, partial [Woeseiaceae bacterium]